MAKPELKEDEQPKTKSGGLLGGIIWGMIGIFAAGGGFAVPYMFPQLFGATSPEDSTSNDEEQAPIIPLESDKSVFIPFGGEKGITVNLDEGRMSRYLHLSITLQVDEAQQEKVKELIEDKKVILKNWLLSYLSDKNMDEVRGAAGQNRLRREIQDYFNTTLFSDGYDRIHDVLFEEFNVQ